MGLGKQKGGVDYHECIVIEFFQPGGSISVVRGGSNMVVIDKINSLA